MMLIAPKYKKNILIKIFKSLLTEIKKRLTLVLKNSKYSNEYYFSMKRFQLKLNSYKPDTSTIQKELQQLKDIKVKLQSSVVSKSQQNYQLRVELQRLRHENQMLQMKVEHLRSENWNGPTKAKQIGKVVELQKLVKKLQKNLQQSLTSANNTIKLYNQQLEINHQSKRQFAQKEYKLKQEIEFLKENSDRLEKQILQINKQNNRIVPNPKQMGNYESKSQRSKCSEINQNVMIPSLIIENRQNKQGKSTGRYKTSPVSQVLAMQEVYMKLMRKLFFKIKDKGLNAKEISGLPQIKTLKNLESVSQHNLGKLLASYPFQINQQDQVHLSFQSIKDQLTRKYKSLSGSNFYQFLLSKLEQCQIVDLLSSDIEISSSKSKNFADEYYSVNGKKHQTSMTTKKHNKSYHEHQDQHFCKAKRSNQGSQHQFQDIDQRRGSQRSRTMTYQTSCNESSSGYGGQFLTLQNYSDQVIQGNFKKDKDPGQRYSVAQRF